MTHTYGEHDDHVGEYHKHHEVFRELAVHQVVHKHACRVVGGYRDILRYNSENL
jgi:hypothetical protein